MIRIRTAAIACALAAPIFPAFAASSASASISNLQFQLLDLTPTDNVASSFSFTDLSGSLTYSLSDSFQGSSESYSFSSKAFGTFNKTASGDIGTSQAAVSAGASELSAQGSASGPNTSFNASVSGNSYYYGGSITLSAQSVLIITADALVAATASNPSPCVASYGYCSPSEYADASAWMNLSYTQPSPAGSINGSSSNNLNVIADARGEFSTSYYTYDYSKSDWYNHPIYSTVVIPPSEGSATDARQFYAVFTNTSNVDQIASFSIGVQVSGRASTAPLAVGGIPSVVPEPSKFTLGLMGLAMLGLAVRRRKA